MIAEGAWEDLKKRPEYNATKDANKSSYFRDELINKKCENYINGALLGDSDLLKGKSAIHEMVKESRFVRRTKVNVMLSSIARFPDNPSGIMRNVTFIPSSEKGKGYVFLQLWVPPSLQGKDEAELRAKRQEVLLIACGAAKNEMPELHTVIGIGIEPPKLTDQIAEDFILLDCADWPADRAEEFRKKNQVFNFFGTPSLRRFEGRTTEFVSPPRDTATMNRISKVVRN